MAEDTKTTNSELEKILARQAKYKSADIMEQMEAAPNEAELNSVDAKDPADFFAKKIAEAKGKAKMANGGMARGKGGKMYQHNYATGGSVTDHLSKVVGPPMGQPQSVQAATATMGETPAERSKRLRSGG